MIELGQLEKAHSEFERRNVRVIVSSIEKVSDASQTQTQFPHLVVLSDATRNLSTAIKIMHAGSAADGGDTSAPTTLVVDGTGVVRWVHRPDNVIVRLSPEQVLAAVDKATK